MTGALVWSLLGLAALDSLNPATLVAVSLILLGSRRRPALEALAFTAGAFSTVLLVGSVLFVGAESAASALPEILGWIRRGAFGLAALVLLVAAARSLRPRRRKPVGLPTWFSPASAVGLGLLMTGADLPNAFPYFIAIERMLANGVDVPTGLVALVLYATIYCVPCLVLLAVGLRRGDAVRRRLESLRDRFGSDTVIAPSWTRATGLLLASIGVGSLALLV
jgi:cytochrome c biogenesis protein CcdA